MRRFLIILLLFCAVFSFIKCSKILVACTMPSHSHFTLTFRLAKELADRNHKVTFISPYAQKTLIKNLEDMPIEETINIAEEMKKSLFEIGSTGAIGNKLSEFQIGLIVTEKVLTNKNLQQLLRSGRQFDLVIIEHFFNEAIIGLGHHFKAPVVLLLPLASGNRNNYLVANPAPSSYIPDILGCFTKHMTFWQRLQNFLSNNFQELLREIIFMPKQRQLYNKYINPNMELDEILYNNISLILTNSHFSVNDAIPKAPIIIEIGGYHLNPPKALPTDLQKYLDEAEEGVILFSMGSNLKSKDLTAEVRAALIMAFSKIKQKVLWKFEIELPEASPNVRVMKWLPQQDILAHPNIRAFITHGGLLSTIETIYFGVPIIGIPVFGDQKNNIATAVINGYAVSVPLAELTEGKFSWALEEILNNPKYRENAKKRSSLMHDQPLKPIDSAIYWVEHVIRHKGAKHMRSAGLDLWWYEREMIDIIAFLSAFILIIIFLFIITLKLFFNYLCNPKKNLQELKKKQ